MKKYKIIIILLLFALPNTEVFSQSHVNEILELTTNKLRIINQNLRVLEQTFADIIVASDTTYTNRLYTHTLSSSNIYHINAFTSGDDVSDLNISIYEVDNNGSVQLVARDNITSNDVSLTYRPNKTDDYLFAVTATFNTNKKSCFFNLIIDRE